MSSRSRRAERVEEIERPAEKLSGEAAEDARGGLLPAVRPQSLRPTAGIFDDPFFFDATA